jgi:hypothetical protein
MVINVEKLKKQVDTFKRKKSRKKNPIMKKLEKKLTLKKILKKSKPTLKIETKEVSSILNDPNRFFKDEMEEIGKSMFFK